MLNIKQFILILFSLIFIYIVGIGGYMIIEDFTLVEASYMTAITISTVGFGEVRSLSVGGQIFTIFLIFLGISFVLYSISIIVKFLLEGELNKYIRGVNMKSKISKLENHIIVCGGGRTGSKIIEQFVDSREKFVLLESNEDTVHSLQNEYSDKLLVLTDDATKDETLMEAGIDRAKAVVAVLSTDAQNLFLSLSAKSLNKKVSVITRAVDTSSEKKLKKAGADYIISPLNIAADRIVKIASQSNVSKFIDFLTKSGVEDFKIEQVPVHSHSNLVNKTLREAEIPKKTGLIVIGIDKDGKVDMNPKSTAKITENCKLLVLGKDEQIDLLRDLGHN